MARRKGVVSVFNLLTERYTTHHKLWFMIAPDPVREGPIIEAASKYGITVIIIQPFTNVKDVEKIASLRRLRHVNFY